MKKLMMLAMLGAVVAAPAFAKDKSPEEMRAKVQSMMKEADTDGNGALSKAEWTAESDAKFMEADANKDGSVSVDEKIEMKKAEKAKWKDAK